MKRVLDRSDRRLGGLHLPVLAALMLGSSTKADESGIYESMADIDIGRVFLTPAERDRLDAQRLRAAPDLPHVAAAGKKSPPDPVSKTAAGYITSSRGTLHEWSGNDFVVSQRSLSDTRIFPGDVDLQRHTVTILDGKTAEGDAAKEENSGDAGD